MTDPDKPWWLEKGSDWPWVILFALPLVAILIAILASSFRY